MRARQIDVVVIGGGIAGLATTAALMDRGADVLCLERGVPGAGQSAGAARGFRHLHDEPALVALAVEARAGWRAWEGRAGERLLGDEGALRLGGDLAPEFARLSAAGVTAHEIDGAAIARRLPFLAPVAGPALLDPGAGALHAEVAVRALGGWLGERLVSAEVRGLRARDGAVALDTTDGPIACRCCVVCAGAGSDRLVRSTGLLLGLERRAHLRLTFAIRPAAMSTVASPVLSDRSGAFGPASYGVPEGSGRYAVGLAVGEYPMVAAGAEDVPARADLAVARARLLAYVETALPGLEPVPVGEVLRLTTALARAGDDAFALRRRGAVMVIAGHNLFKFAPRLGDLLAGAALGEEPHPVLVDH